MYIGMNNTGNTYSKGRLSTDDLLSTVAFSTVFPSVSVPWDLNFKTFLAVINTSICKLACL